MTDPPFRPSKTKHHLSACSESVRPYNPGKTITPVRNYLIAVTMSPILKRDIADQIRQTKKFAATAIGSSYLEDEPYRVPVFEEQPESRMLKSENTKDGDRGGPAFTSSSSARQGIGVHGSEIEQDHDYREARWLNTKAAAVDGKGKSKATSEDLDNLEEDETDQLVSDRLSVDGWKDNGSLDQGMPGERFGYAEPELEIMSNGARGDKWKDMMSLLFEVCGLLFFRIYMDHSTCARPLLLFYFLSSDLSSPVNSWNMWRDGESSDALTSFSSLSL